jgi:hypothetical protein
LFILQFDQKEIPYWAGRYPVADDERIEEVISPQVRRRGYFLQEEFLAMCHWKTPRSKKLVESNPPSYIEEVIRVALSTPDERLRVGGFRFDMRR